MTVKGKGTPGKENSLYGVSELRVRLACSKDTKKPVGLEWREQGGSTRRFQEANWIRL